VGGNKLIRFISIAAVFTSPILAGIILGHILDNYFRTEPWLTIGLMVLGFIDGTINLVKMTKEFLKEEKR
jgi:F0F1-type ATP synthase assembly protein I